MQRQVLQISGFFPGCPENDFFRPAVRKIYPEAVAEQRVHIEIIRHHEVPPGDLHRYNPVHAVDPHAFPFNAIRHYVPSSCTFFDSVWLQGVFRDFSAGVFPVPDPDFQVVVHGFHDGSEIFVSRRYFFYRDPSGKSFLAEGKQVVDRESVYQPG